MSASASEAASDMPSRTSAAASPPARREAAGGAVLLGPRQRDALLVRGVMRPVRIPQMGAREHTEIGAAGGEDGVDVGVGGDRADRHRGNAGLVPYAVAERRLEQTTVQG